MARSSRSTTARAVSGAIAPSIAANGFLDDSFMARRCRAGRISSASKSLGRRSIAVAIAAREAESYDRAMDARSAPDASMLRYGEQPGLRFACVLDGQGGCRDLSWADLLSWRPEHGALWVHLERDDTQSQEWLRGRAGLDAVIAEALLAEESRPRVEDYDDALLVVLRGVNRGEADPMLDLVPVHLWIDSSRLISLRDKDHYLMALRQIREALAVGKGPRGTGELFERIATKVVEYLEPVIDELEDEVDELDSKLLAHDSAECRHKLGEIRRQAINLRRYLAPQREALFRLQVEDATWLAKRDKIKLREVTDRVLRYIENLDAIRDRATILHEDLAAQIAEEQARASNRLTMIAAVLLPPSLVAGLLGVNVGGIPGANAPWAFAAVCIVVALIFPLEIWLLRRLKWL
jgi:zinc transporter